jgi:hypothetical protein
MKNQEKKAGFSLNDFNEVQDCQRLYDVILRDSDGNPYEDGEGGFLTVSIIGSEAKELSDFDKRMAKKMISDSWQKKAKGDKFYDRPDIDQVYELKLSRIQIIVKSWSFSDPCTPENIALFFGKNPTFQKQVEDASTDLRNFLPNR